MRDTADFSAGRSPDGSFDDTLSDCLLSQDDHHRMANKLNDMITSVCDYCHERMGNLISAGANEKDKPLQNERDKTLVENSINKLEDKECANSNNKSWLSDKATTNQVCQLANIVEDFTQTCENLCGKQCTALRSAFKVHELMK